MTRSLPIDAFDLSSVEPESKERVLLEAFETHRGRVAIPAFVVAGRQPGPTLLAVAGVHGNEYEGGEAIRRVFERADPAGLRGVYVGIPVCNVFAYEARSRCTPPHLDGLNLARVFPGDAVGSPTERLAHALTQLVLRTLTVNDLFVDFHSASEDSNYLPLVGFRDIPSSGRRTSEEAARHFGGCAIWRFGNQQGMFNAEVSRAGIPTIGTETTGQAGCRQEDVTVFAEGLWNLLRFKGIVPGAPPARDGGPVLTGVTLTAGATGFLRTTQRLGDYVEAGQVVGEIITALGERLEECRAPVSGRIFMQRTTPAIRAGEVVCILGVPIDESLPAGD